jgi:peptide/nickel transport system substrate-binding protein
VPAGELLPPGLFGSRPGAKPDPHDPGRAGRLLAEAGYPDGFQLTIGTPNDRYPNDSQVAQAVAQFLTRIGIRSQVDASTASIFFSRRNKQEYSLYLAGWGSGTGEMSSPLRSLAATPDPATGMGTTNYGGYSNPKFDRLLQQALRTVDDAKREAILQQASAVVMDDHGLVPLYFEVTSWAMKKGLNYVPRTDQYTLAAEIVPAP